MDVRAVAKNVRVSSRKAQLVVDTVRGKKVEEALNILRFLPTPVARVVAKTVKSAAANAENNFQMSPSELRVARIFADEGRTLKRIRPRPRGRASLIRRRFTRITVIVDEEG